MTKIVSSRQELAARSRFLKIATKLALVVASLSAAAPSYARYLPSSGSDKTYFVSTPSTSAGRPYISQQVTTPALIGQNEFGQVGHLRTRSISYAMETNALYTFVRSDLRVEHQYNYAFNFELDARNAGGQSVSIPEGWYQLQIAVIKKIDGNYNRAIGPRLAFDRYVTSTSTIVRVNNGSFSERIALRFADVTATAMKHHLFIELIPLRPKCEVDGAQTECIRTRPDGKADALNSILDADPRYKTYLFEMPFIPFLSAGGFSRNSFDLPVEDLAFLNNSSLSEYIAKAQIYRARSRQGEKQPVTPAEHAQRHKLFYKDLTHSALSPAVRGIRALFRERPQGPLVVNDETMVRNLCQQLIAHQTEFQHRHRTLPNRGMRQRVIEARIEECVRKPQDHMRLSLVTHADRAVPGKIEPISQGQPTFTVFENYISSRVSSIDVSTSVGVKPPAIVAKVLDQVGIGAGHSVSFNNGRARIEQGGSSSTVPLDYNWSIYELPIKGYQQCLEVRPLQDEYRFFYNRTPGAKNGLYICDSKQEGTIRLPEFYAHVFIKCKETTQMECDSVTQSLNVSLRGNRELSAFFYGIRDGIKSEHDNIAQPFGDSVKARNFFLNTPMIGNREVITPLEFPSESIPSFINQISGNYSEVIR